VHAAADGEVAVVAVLIEEGAENPAFAPVWENLPTEDRDHTRAEGTVDAAQLLPADRGYYGYRGSFTTPPCTEDVRWIVLRTPVELSAAQIAAFRGILDGNNRPVQPLGARVVRRSR